MLERNPEVLYELMPQDGRHLGPAAVLLRNGCDETLLLPAEHTVKRPERLTPESRLTQTIAFLGGEPGEDIEHPGQTEDNLLDVRVLHSGW